MPHHTSSPSTNQPEDHLTFTKQPATSCKIRKACSALLTKLTNTSNKHPKIAVLRLQGVIGNSSHLKEGLNLEHIRENIDKAFATKNVKAVAIQINSPGGSPVQSELIYHYIRTLSKEKNIPTYSFAEDVAASGGYWLACISDEIYASESSIIGSIGVISSSFGFVEAIKKLGIERRIYAQGKNKSLLDPFKEERKADTDILYAAQKDVHEAFKNMVRSRRTGKIAPEQEEQLFSGEFWSGKTAKTLGLVDDIGNMHEIMKKKYGTEIKFIHICKPKNWLQRKIGLSLQQHFIAQALHTCQERLLWQKYNL